MNNASRSTLERALPIVAAAYGRKFGARVVIGPSASDAYTDGKTVVVPNIPKDYPAAVLWGFLGHECAHVRYTDFEVHWAKGLHHGLTNILEDGRIEKALAQDYPGTLHDLRQVCAYMVQEEHFQRAEAGMAPAGLLQLYCLYFVRARLLKQTVLDDHFAAAKRHFGAAFPKGAMVRLNALLRKAANLVDTQAAADLAAEIMRMIQEEKEKEEQQQQQQQAGADDASDASQGGDSADQDGDSSDDSPQGQSGSDQQDGDDDADAGDSSQGADQGDAGQDDASQGQQPGDQGDASDGQAQQSAGGAGGDGDDDAQGDDAQGADMTSQQAADALQKILDAGDDDMVKDAITSLREEMQDQADVAEANGTSAVPGRHAQVSIPCPDDQPDYADAATGEAVYQAAKAASARIRQQLNGLVQASRRAATRTARRGKRLDTQRIHRICSGDTRVFRRTTEKEQPNTAVHLLVDMSGSMGTTRNGPGNEPYRVAREAALALAVALEAIPNVNPAVTFFGGYGGSDDAVRPALKHGQRISSSVRSRFAIQPWGTTPMTEALWYAGSEMVRAREDRKLLVVLSDGGPNDPDTTHQALRLFERCGVETIGIGIKEGAIRSFISDSIVIHELADLKGKLFELMEQSLAA